jgi:sodium/bile acid cotransporter 7
MFRRLIPDPFLLALIATVLLASLLPARGIFADLVDLLATAAIMLLFFFHGAKLPREAVIEGVRHWRLHLTILSATFVMFPVVALALAWTLPGLMTPVLWTGILFLAALPATVQSAIAFTSMAGGNVAAAIASSSASQLLGIMLTPVLVSLLAGADGGDGTQLSGIGKILLQILLPFIAGHLLRPLIGAWVDRNRASIAISDRSAILLAVYGAFSKAAIEGVWQRLPPAQLAILIGVCGVMLVIALTYTWASARLLGFDREDEIAILFCGTKKSIVQGVPMARVLFPGPDMGIVLLPIMIFHQMQLMASAWIARRYVARRMPATKAAIDSRSTFGLNGVSEPADQTSISERETKENPA